MVNRQLEIIYILMSRDTVTAGELADRFEVSTRTIYRDVESLSMAGIPVYASKGKGGGIHLMERFVLDKRLLSGEEQRRILAALCSLRETGAVEEGEILQKLEYFFKTDPMNWVSIDFSDWSGRRGELFGQIKEAILGHRVLAFDYYGQYGDMTRREVEPVQLLFKEYTWYVRAYCRLRGAMRLFKVLRMKRVEIQEETFETGERHLNQEERERESARAPGRDVEPEEAVKPGKTMEPKEAVESGKAEAPGKAEGLEKAEIPGKTESLGKAEGEGPGKTEGPGKMGDPGDPGTLAWGEILLRIDKREAYRIYDRFEEEEIKVLPEGDFEIRMHCLVDDWVYGLILSFGPSARVLGPDWVRKELIRRIGQMAGMYEPYGRNTFPEKQGTFLRI